MEESSLPNGQNFKVEVFSSSNQKADVKVILDEDESTVWASEGQISEIFGKARRTIGEHIKNIYSEGELEQESTRRKFRQVQVEGNREVKRGITTYNLDVILSVGYRVKSKTGIEFRQWATEKLRENLIKGYSLNRSRLEKSQKQIEELKRDLNSLRQQNIEIQKNLTSGFLELIINYSRSFDLLERYDKQSLTNDETGDEISNHLEYGLACQAIDELKKNLISKGEASNLFGNEKDESFKGILANISQTVFGQLAYPSIEEQAAQLLYSTIKGHPFSDGNKRIGSFLFIWHLERNNYLYKQNGEPKINDNALVTLALMVAQSDPDHYKIIVKLIINLIKNNQ